MKTTLQFAFLTFVLLPTTFLSAQSIDWMTMTEGDGMQVAKSIAYDPVNEVSYVVGYFDGSGQNVVTSGTDVFSVEGVPLDAVGNTDGFIMKLDANGLVVWYMTVASSGKDFLYAVDIVSDGSVIVGGTCERSFTVDGPLGSYSIADPNDDSNLDGVLLQLSADGELVWSQVESEDRDVIIADVKAGGINIHALYMNTGDGEGGSLSLPAARQYHIRKLSPSGNTIWINSFGALNNNVTLDSPEFQCPRMDIFDGSIGVVGHWNSVDFGINTDQQNHAFPNWSDDTNDDLFVLKFDTNGALLWADAIHQVGDGMAGFDIVMNCEGVYVSGTISDGLFSPATFPGNYNIPTTTNDDMYIAKLDPDLGSTEWVYTINTGLDPNEEILYALDLGVGGEVIAAGTYQNSLDFGGILNLPGTGAEAMVICLDSDGTELWYETIEGDFDDIIFDLEVIDENHLIACGMGSAVPGLIDATDVNSADNAVIIGLSFNASGDLLCCSPPEAGVLSPASAQVCVGEQLILTHTQATDGRILQYSANDIVWSDVMIVEGNSITIDYPLAGKYRVVTDDPICGLFISNNCVVTVEQEGPFHPGGGTCQLALWMRPDSSTFDQNGDLLFTGNAPSAAVAHRLGGSELSPRNADDVYDVNASPLFLPTAINGHPALYFDGTDNLVLQNESITGNEQGLTIWAVVWPDSLPSSTRKILSQGSSTDGYHLNADRFISSAETPGGIEIAPFDHEDQQGPILLQFTLDTETGERRVTINGTELSASETAPLSALAEDATYFNAAMNNDPNDGGPFTLGAASWAYNTEGFEGAIAELIAYEGINDDESFKMICSYLAMRYGLTINGLDYLSSSGAVVFDPNQVVGFDNGIIAVGRDDQRLMWQSTSRSLEAGEFLQITVEASDALEDQTFLNVGHQGGNGHALSSWQGIPNSRMQRVWRVQETGETGEIRLAIPDAESNPYNLLLVHSSDPSFASVDQIYCLQGDGQRRFATVNLSAGDYFTFAISDPVVEATVTPPSCAGASDASITIDNVTSIGDVYLAWEALGIEGTDAYSIEGLSAGSYELLVIDAGGCAFTFNYEIVAPDPIVIVSTAFSGTSCAGGNDASGVVTLSGGSSPYSYDLTQVTTVGTDLPIAIVGGSASANVITLNGLQQGDYQMIITDANGCTQSMGFTIFSSDIQPPVVACMISLTRSVDEDCDYTMEDLTGGLIVTETCTYSVVQDPAPGQVLLAGTHTLTFTVTDGSGNSSSCSTQLQVIDNTPPAIECLIDQVRSLDADCQYILEDFTLIASAVDACSAVTIEQAPLPGTAVGAGNHTITLTAEDAAGNTTECTFQVDVIDTTAPQLACPGSAVRVAGIDCQYALEDLTGTLSVGDNCSVTTIAQFPAAGSILGTGMHEIEFTVTDQAGNTSSCSTTLEVIDIEAPSASCPDELIRWVNSDCAYTLTDLTIVVTSSDNCGIASIEQQPGIGSTLVAGWHTVEFVVTDFSGNQSTCSLELFVEDSESPVAVCLPNQEAVTNGDCTYVLTDLTAGCSISDNCEIASIIQTPAPGTALTAGDHVINIEVTDVFGNTSNTSFNLTVVSSVTIELDCPADMTRSLGDGCTYELEDFITDMNLSGGCSGFTFQQSPAAGATLGEGVHVITLSGSDTEGNVLSCDFNLEVLDLSAPVVTCLSDILIQEPECMLTLDDYAAILVASDCNSTSITQTPAPGTMLPPGTHVISIEILDLEGNATTCAFDLTFESTAYPTISCGALPVAEVDGCEYIIPDLTSSVISIGSCDGNPVLEQSPAAGTVVTQDEVVITFTVTDSYGSASCDELLQINHIDEVTITCGGNITETISVNGDGCGAVVNYAMPEAAALCGDPDFELIAGLPSGSVFPVGVTTVTWKALVATGEFAMCSFDVTVVDDIAPFIECQPAISTCDPLVFFDAPEASDPCGIASVERVDGIDLNSGEVFPIGTTVIEWEATDENGNVSSCSLEITVVESATVSFSVSEISTCANEEALDVTDLVQSDADQITWSANAPDGVVTISQLGAGEHLVIVTTGEGSCVNSAELVVNVGALPLIDAGEDFAVCGMNAELQASSNTSDLLWTAGDGAFILSGETADLASVESDIFGAVPFTVTAISEMGCVNQDEVVVHFTESPTSIDLGEDLLLNFPREVVVETNFNGVGSLNMEWEGADADLQQNASDILINGLQAGSYLLIVEVSNPPCASVMDTLRIEVLDLVIPNGFSPDGDLMNDTYVIRGAERFETIKMEVFDRDGHLVFRDSEYQNDWNGNDLRGRPLPADTYFMVLTLDGDEHRSYLIIRRP